MKSDGPQFHQYQQNEQSPLTSNHKKTINTLLLEAIPEANINLYELLCFIRVFRFCPSPQQYITEVFTL
jgi:hypothetical protein